MLNYFPLTYFFCPLCNVQNFFALICVLKCSCNRVLINLSLEGFLLDGDAPIAFCREINPTFFALALLIVPMIRSHKWE